MSRTVEQLASEAMQLPPSMRAELVDMLVESLDMSPSDEIQEAWTKEAVKRREELRSGKVKGIPRDQVIAEAHRLAKG